MMCGHQRGKPLRGVHMPWVYSRAAVSSTQCQPCLCFVFWHHRMHSGGMSLVKLCTCPVALTCPVVQRSLPLYR